MSINSTRRPRGDGRKIRAARKRQGWSCRELARKAKVTRQTVYNIEAGEPYRMATMEKLVKALGGRVSVEVPLQGPPA